MSSKVSICSIDPALKEKVKRLQFNKQKGNFAIICKIDADKLLVEEDTALTEEALDFGSDGLTLEDVANILPAHQPRYLIYSSVLNHSDGRVSFPLSFIFASPSGCKPEMSMMYAGSKLELVNHLDMTREFLGGACCDEEKEIVDAYKDDINCPLCLNLLKDHTLASCIDKVTQKMQAENYDSQTFAINAMVPNSVRIREHSLSVFASEKFSDFPGNVLSVKEAFKYALISKLEDGISKKSDVKSLLRVTAVVDYEDDAKEMFSLPARKNVNRKRKRNNPKSSDPTWNSLQESLDNLNDIEAMKAYFPCPPEVPTVSCFLKEVLCFQESIFVGGRYNKYSRELSQTPWFIDGVRKTETSLQELACQKIQEYFAADDVKFISAGREDVDVRMLGSGRPFALELINPRKTVVSDEEMHQLQLSINNSSPLIAVNKLQVVLKNDMTILKEGEEHKIKHYSALVYVKDGVNVEKLAKLDEIKDLVIAQRTPIRVLHSYHHNSTFFQIGPPSQKFVQSVISGRPLFPKVMFVNDIQLDWPPTKTDKKHADESARSL
eukprot:gene19836-21778_t